MIFQLAILAENKLYFFRKLFRNKLLTFHKLNCFFISVPVKTPDKDFSNFPFL